MDKQPCCFEGCPNTADGERPLQIAMFRPGFTVQGEDAYPCAEHRLAVNLTTHELRGDLDEVLPASAA